jgi:hypothetical protein
MAAETILVPELRVHREHFGILAMADVTGKGIGMKQEHRHSTHERTQTAIFVHEVSFLFLCIHDHDMHHTMTGYVRIILIQQRQKGRVDGKRLRA